MTSVFQLYGRPLAENEPLPPLRITGELEGYTSGEAYEGRLQIIDSIGKCVVEIVESSLPPGSYAFVDNFTKEIVLRWPAYAPPDAMASGVPNGDFEQGNDGSWRFGAGWSIEAGGAETGTYSAVYQNQRGIQSIESNRVPYTPGQSITAACRFQQGASSSGNLVGRILLIWCDANGNMVPGGEGISWTGGTLIRSGSNGEWRTSDVTGASSHPNVATVAVGFSANRKKQNKLCRVDNFTWNHEYTTGTNSDLDFTVTFKVTDSANRIAYWTGTVGKYSLFFTSQPYPHFVFESVTAQMPDVANARLDIPPNLFDSATAEMAPLSGDLRSIQGSYDHPAEDFTTGEMSPLSGAIRDIMRAYDIGVESVDCTMSPTSGTLLAILITQSNMEAVTGTMSPTSGTLL
ncbi:Phage tail fiber protein [Xylella phage Cota]|uniref:Phage tail fiber protein n=1 Tax=Xylella phage Cota TaxID=2699877 RepID=A0A6F8ZKC5_9CAUD|nr:Phage tail fiber protein [Xylella phage Cota]